MFKSRPHKTIWTLILLVLLFALSACTQQPTDKTEIVNLHWIEDKSGTLSFDDVRHLDLENQWQKAEKAAPNFGFTNSVFWFSLPFNNDRQHSVPMLLEIAFPLHDKLDVYFLNGDKLQQTYQSGDQRPFSERPLNHRNFLFPQTVPAETKLRVVVRLESSDTVYFPMLVMASDEFFAQDQQHILFLGLFFGFLSIMLVYNLLLYFSTQQESYLYYVWFIAATIYLQLAQKGLGFQYIWPNQMLFNHLSIPAVNFILMISSLLFIMNFLGLDDKQYPKTIRLFKRLMWTAGIMLLLTIGIVVSGAYIIPYSALLISAVVLGILTTLIVVVVLTRLSYEGRTSAQILLVAWLSLLIGICLFALGRMGLPMPMLLAENAMLIGSTFEAALISFALARQIKIERDARMQAQEVALSNERKTLEVQNTLLSLQKQNTQELEIKVKERTQKLENAMVELREANHKLDNLARLDGLTGLSNRRHFDESFENTWQLGLKQQQPISILMCDIDYFKSINDTYGHSFGDQCLIKVAGILKACVSEPEYLAARFGGEEFIIMLPHTKTSVAINVAEKIRQEIEKLRLKYEGKQVKFTISVGIATATPEQSLQENTLKDNADQALYRAKETGRNRVIAFNSL